MADMTCDAYQLIASSNPGPMMIFATRYSKIRLHKSLNEMLFLNYTF